MHLPKTRDVNPPIAAAHPLVGSLLSRCKASVDHDADPALITLDRAHLGSACVTRLRDAEFDDPRARKQALIDRHHVVRAVSKQTRSSVAVNGPAHPGAPVQPTSIIVERLDLHVDFGKAGMACKGIAHDLPLEHQLR